MANSASQPSGMTARSEFRFWVKFAAVVALCFQVLFPPHLLAAAPDGSGFMLCNTSAPMVDQALTKALSVEKIRKGDVQGLKCADCVGALLTALPAPDLLVVPVIYAEAERAPAPAYTDARPKARAPPRPHSCGPPELV